MKQDTKKLVTLAMLSAVAYIAVVLIRIPAVSFLKYEPKDVILAITGFMYGPVAALCVTTVVSVVEMVTISTTGWIGMIMNILASAAFACVAALVYKKTRTLKGAVIGLIAGVLSMTAVMILWNYLITPLYMGVPREAVVSMLIPIFLPFNLVKGGLNAGLTMLLYKPIVESLRKAHLVPVSDQPVPQEKRKKMTPGVIAVSIFVIATFVLLFLVMQEKI